MTPRVKAAALLYHNVGPYLPNTWPGLTVSAEAFGRHIGALAARGYQGISAAQWIDRYNSALPEKPVILTFDDAYAGVAEHALPILFRYGFGATVFVVTNLIGAEDAWMRKEKTAPQPLMTAEQIRYWSERGVDFGGHSRTHPDLTRISESDLVDEVHQCRTFLERVIDKPVRSFAYPYGFYDFRVVTVAGSVFEAAFTVDDGLNDDSTDRLTLRRTMVGSTDGPAAIRWRAAKGYYPVQHVRAKLARIKKRILRRN